MSNQEVTSASTTPARQGMLLFVYRNAATGDSTNGGVTGGSTRIVVTGIRYDYGFDSKSGLKYDPKMTVVLPKDMQVFTPSADKPEFTLVIRDNGVIRWLHLEPAAAAPAGQTPYMSGGNFAGTSDSRWQRLTDTELVSVHDRSDTWALHNQLSV
jgi:hypothetical protein